MKYKIEIWQWCRITATYASDSLQDTLDWYKENWKITRENGFCCIELYRDGINLSWDEGYDLGFN